MSSKSANFLLPVTLVFVLLLTACAKNNPPPSTLAPFLTYEIAQPPPILSQSLPLFQVERPDKLHNRIGSPRVLATNKAEEDVLVDPQKPVIYYQEESFRTSRDQFTNIIYRIHFSETPMTLWPFQIGAGKNVGLLFIITLNAKKQPLLITTLHTCGCYLAFVPTSYLAPSAWPKGWRHDKPQKVYGERLPSFLDFTDHRSPPAILFQIASDSHRVSDIRLVTPAEIAASPWRTAPLQPLTALDDLPTRQGGSLSFFETSGPRQDYVKNSQKIWERLLISWWALDWRVGEDKRLDFQKPTSPVFYTSLKPWARHESNLLNFQGFLSYWGWNL